MRPLCQDCTGIVLDLERVRPGPPNKGISRPYLVFTENWDFPSFCSRFLVSQLWPSTEGPRLHAKSGGLFNGYPVMERDIKAYDHKRYVFVGQIEARPARRRSRWGAP